MINEELFSRVINEGDMDKLNELNDYACGGDAEAQYYLYCIYSRPDSIFRNDDLSHYWLKKSCGNGFTKALDRLGEISPNARKSMGVEKTALPDPETIEPGGLFSVRGRIDRTTYLVYSIVYILSLGFVLFLIAQIPLEPKTVSSAYYSYETMEPTPFAFWSNLLSKVVMAIMMIALQGKRAHDTGHSAWFALIPFFGVALLFMKGEQGTNQYGPQPE